MERKGEINKYACDKCGGEIVTVNSEDGVTPMFLKCRAGSIFRTCKGMMVSACYRVPQNLIPDWVWYKPTPEETAKMDADTRYHVEHGGLLIRRMDPLEREKYGIRFRHG